MRVSEAKTFLQKSKGLLGTNRAHPLLLKTHFGIHTFGMRYPIDVCVLDNTHTIVRIKKNLKPNQVFVWNPRFGIVLELPVETVEKEKLKLGDHMRLELG